VVGSKVRCTMQPSRYGPCGVTITVLSLRAATAAFALALVWTMGTLPAKAGVFSVYSDQNGSCYVADTQPGLISIYIYYRSPLFDVGVTGSAFRLGSGGGFSGMLSSVDFRPDFLVLGEIDQGVLVSYGGCLNDRSLLVATVSFSVFGTSASCSHLEVLPYSAGGVVETYRCDGTMEPAPSTRLVVNYEVSCGSLWCVTETEKATWGSIKALYR